jgi:hypothetical protein
LKYVNTEEEETTLLAMTMKDLALQRDAVSCMQLEHCILGVMGRFEECCLVYDVAGGRLVVSFEVGSAAALWSMWTLRRKKLR